MARVTAPLPSGRDINRAVLGKLRIQGGVTPSMLPFSITFSPTLVIAAGRIEKLGMDIRSFREPLMRSIRQVMAPSIRANFAAGGRPAWEPLSESTIEIRSRKGIVGNSPLIRSGALSKVAGQINIWSVSQKAAMIQNLPSQVWYGVIHQAGYEGAGSMKSYLRRTKGDAGKALALMTAEKITPILGGATLGRTTGSLKGAGKRAYRITSVAGTAGGNREVHSIPQREFVVLQPEDEDRITEIFIEWLGERVKRAWP